MVELAICLDTSGSMTGLIDAARARLWDIVNELALATPTPTLRVALLTFGNNGHSVEDGWVRVDLGLTEDLDQVSRQLFALTTNGGEEYVGRVLSAAGSKLAWTSGGSSGAALPLLQMVVVAGNESADQDKVISFRDACKALVSRGVTVNSIYCGSPVDDLAPGWREVATLADGQFAAIDQSTGAMAVATPWDEGLARLSEELNATYVGFGQRGRSAASNQWEQDSNAAKLSTAVAAQRGASKASGIYNCATWDLVDACAQPDFKLESVKAEDLPVAMRGMSLEQRQAFVDGMRDRREGIRKGVEELARKRQLYVDEKAGESAVQGQASLGAAMLEAIRKLGVAKGLSWETPRQAPSEPLAEGAGVAAGAEAAPAPPR
jgi:hypothetical protein